MATLERKTAIIKKVLSEVNLDINDGNVHKYADYTAFYHDKLVIVSNKVVLNK